MSLHPDNTGRSGLLAKKPWQWAVCVSFFFAVSAHLFALTNPLHNYDDIVAQPLGYGTGVYSGRWFLQTLGDAALKADLCYNVTALNGLMLLLLLAIAVGFLVSALNLRCRSLACVMGALFLVFPTSASIMMFRFTAPYYGLSLLLAVFAAWVLGRFPGALVVSVISIALSLGIYQSNVPLTVSILVLMLLRDSLDGEHTLKYLLLRGLYDCLALILGLALYYLAMQRMLKLWGTDLLSYQGLDTMGQISLSQLPSLLKSAFLTPLCLSIKNYCGLASSELVRKLYLLLEILCGVLLIWVWLARRPKFLNWLASVVLLLLFPVSVGFVIIMCPNAGIYTLMVYSFAIFLCLPVVLFELVPTNGGGQCRLWSVGKKAVLLLLCCFVFTYTYEDNINYNALHYADRQTENHYVSLVTQVRMTEGFTSESKWAFVGECQDPLMESPAWSKAVTYGGSSNYAGLLSSYSRPFWLNTYLGYTVPLATDKEVTALCQTEAVQQMPCWPDNGSVQVIGDTVVIKYREISPS